MVFTGRPGASGLLPVCSYWPPAFAAAQLSHPNRCVGKSARRSKVNALRTIQSKLIRDQDHYSVLGLKAKASAHEVKRAYRNLCKQYHPDKAAHLDETTKRERAAQMVRLNAAYQAGPE
eukprot:g15226.t1